MKTVWPDTFVEEANLSRNIFLLRKALGETPQDHQYIVTVPGRGYRFAEDVQLVPDRELSIVAASHTKIQVQVKEAYELAMDRRCRGHCACRGSRGVPAVFSPLTCPKRKGRSCARRLRQLDRRPCL